MTSIYILTQMEVDDLSTVIEWWKLHRNEFPIMAECARDYLAIPCSTVHVERLFSRARDLLSIRRTTMSPWRIEQLCILKDNYMVEGVFKSSS